MTAQDDRILVRGGLVVDGSGNDARSADIVVEGGYISEVRPPGAVPPSIGTTIDAAGLVVAPGFIDVHAHADNAPLLGQDDTSKILQGVTTEVVGNCGFSLAPIRSRYQQDFHSLTGRIFPPLADRWQSWGDFVSYLDSCGYVTNYAPLVGHSTLLVSELGLTDRSPDADELAAMRRSLEHCLGNGAFGLSSGLVYSPGSLNQVAELKQLAAVLGESRIYTTHMRSESDRIMESLDETVAVGRESRCPVHISHIKARGRRNWGRMPSILGRVKELRSQAKVTLDMYPYIAGSTMMASILPPFVLAESNDHILARLRSPAARKEISDALEYGWPGWESHIDAAGGWDGILVCSTASHRREGQTVAELALKEDCSPADLVMNLLAEERLQATIAVFVMNRFDVAAAAEDSDVMIGSDGLPPGAGGKPHPRTYGTFPYFLGEFVMRQKTVDLPTGIRRMTSMPAETFGIPERGRIEPGWVADLVAFDLDIVDHSGSYRDPEVAPTGIEWVMQRGLIVVDGGVYSGLRTGQRLLPSR